MFDRPVADGNSTTTGGQVIGRSDHYNEQGKMYARKGNFATCGNSKGGWPVYGTAGDWMDNGFPLVKDRDRVLCPCGKNFVLAAGSSSAFYSESKGAAPPAPAARYGQQFTLLDEERRPLSNVRYRIVTDSGQVFTGTTNAVGQTQRVVTQGSTRLKLQLEN